MKLLLERLPEATVISVGHRAELEAFHTRKLVLEYHPEGARLVATNRCQWTFRRSARFLARMLNREAPPPRDSADLNPRNPSFQSGRTKTSPLRLPLTMLSPGGGCRPAAAAKSVASLRRRKMP